jgi:hypothetical protein
MSCNKDLQQVTLWCYSENLVLPLPLGHVQALHTEAAVGHTDSLWQYCHCRVLPSAFSSRLHLTPVARPQDIVATIGGLCTKPNWR